MKVYSGSGLGDFYLQLIRDITEMGRKIETRHGRCVELPFPVIFEYEKPGHCWMRIPNRKFNPFLAIAEVVWILSGNGNVKWISHFSKNLLQFADEGKPDFHGAYGLRMRKWPVSYSGHTHTDQILNAVATLSDDGVTRRAVISLWDPERDGLHKGSNDYPCNNYIYYSLRDGVLDQTVVMRSNDVVWGSPYNAVQFSHLHALVAGELKAKTGKKIQIGTMRYFIQNLHYYLDLYKPTLSTLIEHAFDGKDFVAESAPNFDLVSQKQFEETAKTVEWILHPKNEVMPELEGVGYWGNTIPKMILIHETHKTNPHLAEDLIMSLGQPLTDLVRMFYNNHKESK